MEEEDDDGPNHAFTPEVIAEVNRLSAEWWEEFVRREGRWGVFKLYVWVTIRNSRWRLKGWWRNQRHPCPPRWWHVFRRYRWRR
jgi:hypothetical protein